jgi:hypothetical protein
MLLGILAKDPDIGDFLDRLDRFGQRARDDVEVGDDIIFVIPDAFANELQ